METMITTPSTRIDGISASLGVLAGRVDEDTWQFLRLVRNELAASAEQVKELERCAVLPRATLHDFGAAQALLRREKARGRGLAGIFENRKDGERHE